MAFFVSGGLTAAVGVVSLASLISPAEAVADPNCLSSEAGSVSAVQIDGYTSTSRGTRSEVRVINNNDVSCQHISSIFAWNGSGGFEFGYVVGYSNCPGFTGTFYNNPKPFYWAYNSQGGFVGCKVWTGRSLTQASYQTMRGSDTNHDYRWGPWLNGEELLPGTLGVILDFNSAANGWGMERGDSGDDGYARFNDLSEFHDNGSWSHWDDQRLNSDNDSKYNFDEIDVYTGRTVVQ